MNKNDIEIADIPRVDPHFQERLTERGGLNPNGEPMFRVLRGCDRFTMIGGPWVKFDDNGNEIGIQVEMRRVLKYPGTENRYIFEQWVPAENYGTPAQWEQKHTKVYNGHRIEELGQYPANGDYELLSRHGVLEYITLNKNNEIVSREFAPLTDTVCDAVIATAVLNLHLPTAIKVEHARRQREVEENGRIERQMAMIENMERPGWAQRPHIAWNSKAAADIQLPTREEISKYV